MGDLRAGLPASHDYATGRAGSGVSLTREMVYAPSTLTPNQVTGLTGRTSGTFVQTTSEQGTTLTSSTGQVLAQTQPGQPGVIVSTVSQEKPAAPQGIISGPSGVQTNAGVGGGGGGGRGEQSSAIKDFGMGIYGGVILVGGTIGDFYRRGMGYALYGGMISPGGTPYAETYAQKIGKGVSVEYAKNIKPESAAGTVGFYAPSVALIGAGAYGVYSSYKSFAGMGLTRGEAIGQTAISTAEGISPVKWKYSMTDIGQISQAQDYFKIESAKTPAVGIRYVSGNKALDIFGKSIPAQTGASYTQQNIAVYQMTGARAYTSLGVTKQDFIIPTYGGRVYAGGDTTASMAKGLLQPQFKGLTPSFGTTITTEPSAFRFGGATQQYKTASNEFILSKSGKLDTFYIKNIGGTIATSGEQFGSTTIGMRIAKEPSAILKISGMSGGEYKPVGMGGTITIQTGTQSLIQNIPVIGIKPPSMTLPSPSLGISTALGSIAGLSSISSAAGRQATLQIPKVTETTTQVPRISSIQLTIPAQTQIPAQALVPTQAAFQIPAAATIPALMAITIPATASITAAPAMAIPGFMLPPPQVPAFFPFSMKFGFDMSMASRKVGARGKRKYTPDYAGLLLGKRGKAPKTITGAEIRPITKGFKWEFGKKKLFGGIF